MDSAVINVLIVDDLADNRDTLGALLSDAQDYRYHCIFARNGGEALALLEQQPIDVVLLDVMMPIMDGFETCRRIRSTPGLLDIPVIMVTALNDRDSRLKGIDAGADDFLSKPIDEDELLAKMRSIARLNRYRRLIEQSQRVAFLESYDALTQLPKRDLLLRQIDAALAKSAGQAGVAVLRVGLDNASDIGERLGSDSGDQLLNEVAARLMASVSRKVLSAVTLARLGGVQFALLLSNDGSDCKTASTAEHIAERLRQALRQPYSIDGQTLLLTASVGISLGPQDGSDAVTLLANAATTMAHVRHDGGDGQQFYTPALVSAAADASAT